MRQGCQRTWIQEGHRTRTVRSPPASLSVPSSRAGELTYSSLLTNSKRTINAVSVFDFCSDIVEGVPDPIGDEGPDGEPKKKRVRKKKEAAPKEEEEEVKEEESEEEDE